MTTSEFLLPDAGEGLTEAEIVSWKVAPGDTVAVNQTLVEIETAKSLVELPSPFEGVVEAILVEEGTTVAVGTPIISVETSGEPGGRVTPESASSGGRVAPERSEDAYRDPDTTESDTASTITAED